MLDGRMLTALFQDDEILVVDKPSGLPSQPGEGVGVSLVSAVERDFGFRPFLVHRLDRETAGCIIVAKSSRAASRWSELIAGREIRKIYRAVCSGIPVEPEGVIRDALDSGGRSLPASTSYRTLARFGADEANRGEVFSYLELELGTGRTHQIRRHLALHGHPILGDDRHGDFTLNRSLKKTAGLKRLLLWAHELDLPGGAPLRASIPPHFIAFFAHFPDSPDPEVF